MKAKFTIQVEEASLLKLDTLARGLRNKGYSRMSRGYLLSAAGEWLCKLYEEGDIDDCIEALGSQLLCYAEERELDIDDDNKAKVNKPRKLKIKKN